MLLALRDPLLAGESSDLMARLPMLVRGLYSEGYRPADVPDRVRHAGDFLATIAAELQPPDPDAGAAAARAVFGVLNRRVTPGEVRQVRAMLVDDVRSLWPDPSDTSGAAGESAASDGALAGA